MRATTIMGTNRTGISVAPELSAEMIEGAREFSPTREGDGHEILRVRIAYAEDAEPIGSVPLPGSLSQLADTAIKAVQGKSPLTFLDKLGERLAFERTGVRLYQGVIAKYDAFGAFHGGPQREDLEHILAEEFQHFQLLTNAVEQMGGDATVVTPSADLHAVMSNGILAAVADPRVDLLQSLEGALVAELADNDCWDALIELAQQAGEEDLVQRFTRASESEREHLTQVRTWVAAGQGRPTNGAAKRGSQSGRRARSSGGKRTRHRKAS
ncbi:MAG: ferritin-like domain-containing protein [Candidatus Binatia bacterium]